MRQELTFPLSIIGRPQGARAPRMLQMVSTDFYDIREIKSSEVKLAFQYSANGNAGVPHPTSDSNNAVEYDGNSYRLLGKIPKSIDFCFSNPYARDRSVNFDQGLFHHFDNKVQLLKHLGLIPQRTWPYTNRMDDHRDITSLEANINTIDGIDQSELAEIKECFNKVADGLIITDDRFLWTPSPQPKIIVDVVWGRDWKQSYIDICPWYVRDCPIRHYNISRRLFALDDTQGAETYVESLLSSGFGNGELVRRKGIAALVDVEPYDGSAEHLRQISRELAYAICGSTDADSSPAQKLTGNQLHLIDTAKAGLLQENYLLDRPFDMSSQVEELFELWKSMGRKYAYGIFGMPPEFAEKFIGQMIDELEPISPDFWSKAPEYGGPKP